MKRIFPLLLGGLLLAAPIQGQENPSLHYMAPESGMLIHSAITE